MATKKITPKKSKMTKTKSAYVLGLPADMPAKEVVTKAKADGIKLSEGHVYSIRSGAKKKGTTKAKKGSKIAKANATPAKGNKGSKADFVRSQPSDMKAVEVVLAAKKAGITMTGSYVYEVRSADKRPGNVAKKVSPKAAVPTPKKVAKKTPGRSSGSEQEFRKLVIALGVEQAISLLADVKKKLEQLIAGA